MALPERSAPAAASVSQDQLFYDPEFESQYPALYSFLKDTNYSNGKVRLTGTLTMFVKAGRLTMGVNDNDRLLTAYVNAVTIDELLFTVNEGIEHDNLDWKKKAVYQSPAKIPY